jgi:ribonuclease G
MSKELFISSSPHETKIAALEDDQLVEVYFERDAEAGLVGGIYKGRVSRVLPGMQSAFVDIGLERDAFLYVSDFFLEDTEEFDKVFDDAESRVSRGAGTEGLGVIVSQPQPAPVAALSEATAGAGSEQPVETAGPEPTKTPTAEAPQFPPALQGTEAIPTAEAPEAPTPPVVTAPPPLPSKPSGDHPDFRRHEFRGRRRRRRGGRDFGERSFRERAAGEHKFVPKPEDTEPHPFEILPGESLAKYGHKTPEGPPAEIGEGTTSEPSTAEALYSAEPEAGSRRAGEVPQDASLEAAGTEPAPLEAEGPEIKTPVEGAPAIDEDLAPPEHGCKTPESASEMAGGNEAPSPFGHAEEIQVPEPVPPFHPAGALPVPRSTPREKPEAATPTPSVTSALETEATTSESPGGSTEETGIAAPIPTGAPGEAAPSPDVETDMAVGEEVEAREEEPASVEADSAEPVAGEASREGQAPAPPTAPPSGEPAERSYTLREPHQRPRFAPRRGRKGRRGIGNPRPRNEPSRPGNNQPLQITELLKEGQEILVQIAKEPLGTKGARITSHVALPGRYLVYMPTINHIGVSRKITSEEERLRLRNIILENKGSLSGGFIVRTAGAGRPEEELKADLKFLMTLWNEIRARTERARAPALIHRDLDLVQRTLRDILTPDFKQVRVDSESEYERVLDFVSRCQPSLVGHVKLYTRNTPLFEEFGIQGEIEKALKPKIWLKSGGYIVINQTEALVAIDVNTGKYVGKTNRLEDTILKTNIDAVNEIVRQVRLRDLGGIIVIDFIDMDERKNRFKVIQALEEALRRDRAPTKVVSFHDFGLVAITRKRVRQSLERTLCAPCDYCSGSGWIKSPTTVCFEILAEVRKMADHIEGAVLTLRVNPEVAKALKARDGGLVSEMESLTHKDVVIKSDPTVQQERFEIF